jgi:hypothetical protein
MESFKHLRQKINEKLTNSNRIIFVAIITTILYILLIGFNFGFDFIREKDIIWFDSPSGGKNIYILFFTVVILSPIIETYIYQSLPYRYLNRIVFLKERKYLILIISALFFGLSHFYSLFYVIYGFFMGLGFMYSYMVRIRTDNRTFYLIAMCHSLVNLGVFISHNI